MATGTLRVYLGAAPGVGKTFAMLNEGRRAHDRGADVVVGYLETHGRPRTIEQLGDLEMIPRIERVYRGSTFEEMDLDAILARRPERVLVDELAHTNVPGSRNAKRFQDVQELLDAGIDVISTVNIQHLESLNDVVEQITGIVQHETIPDAIVRCAEQVELVDQTPEALRRRLAHGNIYAPEKIDAALSNYFRPGNLAALRELALLWLADKVDDSLEDYRERHGIATAWETRERIVVAITGAPGGERLIRRAARIAQRVRGELIGIHVRRDDGLTDRPGTRVEEHRALLRELGGTYRMIAGPDVAAALVEFAQTQNATQIVLGASNRSRWEEAVRGSVINQVIRTSGTIDVHVVSQPSDDSETTEFPIRIRRPHLAPLSRRRRLIAMVTATIGLPLLTAVLHSLGSSVGLPSVLILYLLAVVGVGAIGGVLVALGAAVAAFLLVNWYFTPPISRFTVASGENLLALIVFVIAALLVSYLVDTAARRREEVLRVRVEAETMARMAGSLTQEDMLPRLVDQIRTAFDATGVAVVRGDGTSHVTESVSGTLGHDPSDADDIVEALGEGRSLVIQGAHLDPDDARLLRALTTQASLVLEARRLQGEAARAVELAQANELRAGLLQAVSHDLRTPLASIKASISSLRQGDVTWQPEQIDEFRATIEDETDRLAGLVESLLEMSRLQAGVLRPMITETSTEEVVPSALAGLGPRATRVILEIPDDLPTFDADPQLLARVLANLVDNALKYSPEAAPPTLTAGAVSGQVLLRVVDRGSGIDVKARAQVFQPFQRLVDHGTGVGLGLAIAHGFTNAMSGELSIEDTPGGGTTMVVSLPQHRRGS